MSMKTLTLLLTFSLSFCALAAPEDVYKSLGLSQGMVTVASESEDLCSDGPFQIIGKKDEEVLMVGTNITIDLPRKEKKNVVAADADTCAEDAHSILKGKKLQMVTTVHHCPPKQKKLEGVTEETIEIIGQTIKYSRRTEKEKSECVFKWSANEEK